MCYNIIIVSDFTSIEREFTDLSAVDAHDRPFWHESSIAPNSPTVEQASRANGLKPALLAVAAFFGLNR